MPKTLNQELVVTYVKDFMDFIEELPNELSPMVSQLFYLDSKMRHQIDKIEHKMSKMADSTNAKHKEHHSIKIDKYFRRIQKITDKKMKISEKMSNLIETRGKRLAEDYEGLLLSNQTESFTYGTRSGRMWSQNDSNKPIDR